MSRLFLAIGFSALIAAAPYPPEATSFVEIPATHASYGHKSGNFQPSRNTNGAEGLSILATGGVVTGGAAVSTINNQDGVGAGSDVYKLYSGDGSLAAGWPTEEQWVSFENMFNNSKPVMFSSCKDNSYDGVNDSGPEVGAIYDAIQDIAAQTKVDHRFILAIIMQESGGCVRVPTSANGVVNPGLMQSHNGAGTCKPNENQPGQNPCPTSTISLMIQDGAGGTDSGDGLAQTINQATNQFAVTKSRAFYIAARIYNSGSVDPSNNLEAGIATHCYSTDVANRLTGWVNAASTCPYDG